MDIFFRTPVLLLNLIELFIDVIYFDKFENSRVICYPSLNSVANAKKKRNSVMTRLILTMQECSNNYVMATVFYR